MSAIEDAVLDALDEAPVGRICGGAPYQGRLATVQMLAHNISASDSATLRAIHRLHRKGLVQVFDAIDPQVGARRLMDTAGVS